MPPPNVLDVFIALSPYRRKYLWRSWSSRISWCSSLSVCPPPPPFPVQLYVSRYPPYQRESIFVVAPLALSPSVPPGLVPVDLLNAARAPFHVHHPCSCALLVVHSHPNPKRVFSGDQQSVGESAPRARTTGPRLTCLITIGPDQNLYSTRIYARKRDITGIPTIFRCQQKTSKGAVLPTYGLFGTGFSPSLHWTRPWAPKIMNSTFESFHGSRKSPKIIYREHLDGGMPQVTHISFEHQTMGTPRKTELV